MFGLMVRPKSEDPKRSIVQVKLTASERADLDRLVAAWRVEGADFGAEVNVSTVIRALIKRDLRARGLDKPAVPAASPNSKRTRGKGQSTG
jgi:hypothetical protein